MLWRFKILAKIILSRVPLAYWAWRKLGIFRHGYMHVPDYSIGVVTAHVARLGGADRIRGATCLELGPGDSLATALIAHAFGAARIILVDAGDFASRDMRTYRKLAEELTARGLSAPDLSRCATVEAMLASVKAVYLTNGLTSLQTLECASIDFIWSQAVLEHIRYQEIGDLFREFRRILKQEGAMSHRIDFKDHLDGSLNNLRFSERVWESEFMARSGFYTNRVRFSSMTAAIARAGFDNAVLSVSKWDRLPLSRDRMNEKFRDISEEDLLISDCDILARPL